MKSAVLFSMVVAAVLMCLSVPLSAQEGRDLLAWNESPSEHVFVKEAVGDVVVYGADDINLVDATASEPTGVASAATTEYKYDDGTPEAFTRIADAHEQEYAQRFRLPRAGTVASATACFGRDQDDNDANVSFVLTFYRDTGGRPGNRLASYSASASGLTRGRGTCVGVSQGDITRQRLESGDTWLSVSWLNSSGKFFAEDHNGPGGTGNFWRARSSAGGSWSSWNAETVATAYFIRLGVDHGGSTPPPPDPDPPPTPGCTPTTTVLSFDGGYDVSMCYRTPDGTGQVGNLGVGRVWPAVVLQPGQRGSAGQGAQRLLPQRLPLGLRGAGHHCRVQSPGDRPRRQTLDAQQPARDDGGYEERYGRVQVR